MTSLSLGMIALAGLALAVERDATNYVGVKTCAICHRNIMTEEDNGNQMGEWEVGPHARAFAILGSPAAKTIGKKLGVADPRKSGKCLKCHSTAYNFTETIATEEIQPEDGVVCESCHGPGKKYIGKGIMTDKAKAVEAGLIAPATQTCKLCHNEESPTFKGFNEAASAKEIAHSDPKLRIKRAQTRGE